jgi:hypothetical protein
MLQRLTIKPPSSSRSTSVPNDSTHANKYSAHLRTYTSPDAALRRHSGRQLHAMRLPSAVFRQQLQGGGWLDNRVEPPQEQQSKRVRNERAVGSYSKIFPIDAIHLPRTISSSSNMRFVSTTVSPLLVPLSSG